MKKLDFCLGCVYRVHRVSIYMFYNVIWQRFLWQEYKKSLHNLLQINEVQHNIKIAKIKIARKAQML